MLLLRSVQPPSRSSYYPSLCFVAGPAKLMGFRRGFSSGRQAQCPRSGFSTQIWIYEELFFKIDFSDHDFQPEYGIIYSRFSSRFGLQNETHTLKSIYLFQNGHFCKIPLVSVSKVFIWGPQNEPETAQIRFPLVSLKSIWDSSILTRF